MTNNVYFSDNKIQCLMENFDSLSEEQKLMVNNFFLDSSNFKKYYDLLQNMMWIKKCPDPEEFLYEKSEYLPVEMIDSLYPHIKKLFIEAMNSEDPYKYIITYGSTRTGKSLSGQLFIVYAIMYINLLRFPHLYYGLNPLSNICIYLVSFKKDKTKELILAPIINILYASKFFRNLKYEDAVRSKGVTSDGIIHFSEACNISSNGGLTFPKVLVITGSQVSDFIGGNIITGVISEINHFKELAHISDEEVLKIFSKLDGRISGTVSRNKFPCFLYLDSSANNSESSIENLVQNELKKRKSCYYQNYARWEVLPEKFPIWANANKIEGENIDIFKSQTWKDSWATEIRQEKTFDVCVGNGNYPAKIINKNNMDLDIPKELIKKFPIDCYDDLMVDLIGGIQDIGGIPSSSESKLIQDRRIIENIWDDNLINIEGEIIAGASSIPERLIWNQIYDKFFIDVGTGRFQIRRSPKEPRFIGVDTAHCTDTKTEIYTKRGWLKYNELKLDDKVLALDETLNKSVWTDIIDINIFSKQKREMLEINGKTHSSLSTMNHRWAVDHYKRGPYEKKFITSDKLNSCHRIIRNRGLVEDIPTESIYSNSFVEIVAWFWTEDTICKNRDKTQSFYVDLYQSERVNSKYCKRINNVLLKEYGEPIEYMTRNGRNFPSNPEWRTIRHKDKEKRIWYLNSYIGKQLINVAPNKVVTYDFILSLTKYQLEIFVKTSFDADRSRDITLLQKSKERLKGLEMAIILLGNAVNSGKNNYDGMYYVAKIKSPRVKIYKKNMKKVIYDGIIWCPTTKTGTWFARRNGKTYFTGNSAKGCLMSVAMLHNEIGNNGETLQVVDFSLAVAPDETGINLDALNLFLIDLYRLGNLSIRIIAFDTFQSKQTQQSLKRLGLEVIEFSVDRTIEPYQFFVGILYSKLFKSGKNIYLKNNLNSLYRMKDKNKNEKIDKNKGTPIHKYNYNWQLSKAGSYEKDISDGVCRASYLLAHDEKARPVTLYSAENQRLGTEKKEKGGEKIDLKLLKQLYKIYGAK